MDLLILDWTAVTPADCLRRNAGDAAADDRVDPRRTGRPRRRIVAVRMTIRYEEH